MVKPQLDDYYIARIRYWPEDKLHIVVIQIYYVWGDGAIDFMTFSGGEGDPIRSTQCAHFELLEKIEVDKYK